MFMELFYVCENGDEYYTNIGVRFETPMDVISAFKILKVSTTSTEKSNFILDLRDENGFFIDSLKLNNTNVKFATGHEPLDESEYKEINRQYRKRADPRAGEQS